MSVFKLAVRFEGKQVRLGYDILSGAQTILFVVGDFSLKPEDDFLVIVSGDIPVVAIVTAGKVTEFPMTANEARRIAAIVPSQEHNGNGGIEVKTITEIHIGEIKPLPTSLQEVVAEKYTNGDLRDE